jgi:WD40 repeat protein
VTVKVTVVPETRIDAGPIDAVAIDPSDELVACAGGESGRTYSVAVWTLDGGERAWATAAVVATQGRDRLAWSTDGKLLAVACGDGTIRVFDRRGKRTHTLGPGRKGKGAMAVAFAPTGELVSAGFDAMVRVWDVASGTQLRKMSHGGNDWVNTVRVSPGGVVASGGQHAAAKLWDLATGKLRATVAHGPPGPTFGWIGKVEGVAFSRDGALVATAGGGSSRKKEDCSIRVWNTSDGSERATLVGKGENHGLAFLEDGLIAALSYNPDSKTTSHSVVTLWNLATREAVLEIEAPQTAYRLAASLGGPWLLLGRTGWTGYAYEQPLGGIEVWKSVNRLLRDHPIPD